MGVNVGKPTLLVVIVFVRVFIYVCDTTQIDEQSFDHSFGVTYAECTDSCDRRFVCSLSKYTRRYQLCEFFDSTYTSSTRLPGTWVHLKREFDTLVECTSCSSLEECYIDNDGTWGCSVKSCGRPPTLQKAETYGNIHKIGSKILYECNSISSTIECLANGSWTYSELECPCTPLVIPNGDIQVRRLTNGLYEATLDGCDYGFEPRHATQALICNPLEDEWTGNDDVYCDKMVAGQWMKIYTLPHDSDEGIVNAWKRGNISSARYAYRNHIFVDNWEAMPIGDVKLSVLKDDIEVAFITFDGRDSTIWTWFSKERVLQSSWTDLDNSSSSAEFNWEGITRKGNGTVNIRHYALKVLDENTCEGDVGWFAVTWIYYPCDSEDRNYYTRIMYAKGNNASTFLTDEIGIADKFEVWVTLTS